MLTKFNKFIKKIKENLFSLSHKKINWKLILKITRYMAFIFLAGCVLVIGLFFYYTYDLPMPENFSEKQITQSTKIYDRTGKILLYDIYGEEKRELVTFDKISQNLKNAVLTSEDDGFYKHGGIDIKSIFRAILIDLKLQSTSQGASTITQQLVTSSFLNKNQRTLGRKIREAVLAIELERKYSKDEIFNWYLNQIPFGQNAYGVESASQTFFNKPASDLTLAESATLTALIPAPSYYSPYGSHKDKLFARKDYILDRMAKLGYITKDVAEATKKENVVFADISKPIKAPHFVMYVKSYLENKYGEDFLRSKGLKVYTTLDWDLQSFAEQTVKDADKTNKAVNANNAALVALDPKTGEILSLIGSKNYFEKSYPAGCDTNARGKCLFDPKYDVATIGQRQPGSSFKPFVYATAFKKGFTSSTELWDVKTEFNPNCSPLATQSKDIYGSACYNPQNYDGLFRGKLTLRSAIAQSLNIPSVKLLYLSGLKDVLQTASDFGITTLNEPERYGLSLVLGGGEVNLLEMTSAYGVFATEGQKIPPVSILKIEDSNGKIIEQNQKQLTKVLDTQVAREINDILSDNNARAPMFGANSILYVKGSDVAVKTGTTESYKDAWTMGYTPYAVVGVWVGNNDNTPINKKTGAGLAAPIWRKIINKIILTHTAESFTKPDPISQDAKPVLAGTLDPSDTHSILYYINKDDVLGPQPTESILDPQYTNWQAGINNYLKPY